MPLSKCNINNCLKYDFEFICKFTVDLIQWRCKGEQKALKHNWTICWRSSRSFNWFVNRHLEMRHTHTLLIIFKQAQERPVLELWPPCFTFRMELEPVLNNFALVMIVPCIYCENSSALWQTFLCSCGKYLHNSFSFSSAKGTWSWCAFERSLFHILMTSSSAFCQVLYFGLEGGQDMNV